MFPINTKILTADGQWHLNHNEGLGCDYAAIYVPLFAPFNGYISNPYPWVSTIFGSGGIWQELRRDNGDKIQMAHLSKRIVQNCYIQEGTQIGVTGYTGRLRGAIPHLHLQIINKYGVRLDPEKYNWIDMPETTEQYVVRQFKKVWGRDAANGEILYFSLRLKNGSIKPDKLTNTMAFWATKSDSAWQVEKNNYLRGKI